MDRPDLNLLEEWRAEKREQFGARWREAELILCALERFWMFVSDVSPANTALA